MFCESSKIHLKTLNYSIKAEKFVVLKIIIRKIFQTLLC